MGAAARRTNGERGRPVDRDGTAAALDRCREDLLALLDAAQPAELSAPSNGTRWTNEQLLFHMVFGFLVVRRLLPLVRVMSAAPSGVGRGFAAVLNTSRAPFHWVNYAGSCGGALVFNHARMGRLCTHTIDRLAASLRDEPEVRLDRGMPFPTSWDPYFESYMTLAAVYAYPAKHYDHHRQQLTLGQNP